MDLWALVVEGVMGEGGLWQFAFATEKGTSVMGMMTMLLNGWD